MELIDEADLGAPDARALGIGHARGRDLVDIDLADVRMLKQAGNVQERRLASARRRHQRHRLARPERKLGVLEHFEGRGALAVSARDTVQKQDRCVLSRGQRIGRRRDRRMKSRGRGVIHNAAPRPDRAGPRARTDTRLRAARA